MKDSYSLTITPTLPVEQRPALEHLLFFNVNQHRVLPGIQLSIENYGVPEIFEHHGNLRIRIGNLENVQTLFAVSELGPPVGVAIFVRMPSHRLVMLHMAVDTRLRSTVDVNTPVVLELMREIRSTARRMGGIDRVELVYNVRNTALLSTMGERGSPC